MKFQEEFPDFKPEDLPEIPGGFTDESWRNDACPCFINVELRLILFVDFKEVSQREFEAGPRFIVMPSDHEGCFIGDGSTLLETDDWDEVLRLVDKRRSE